MKTVGDLLKKARLEKGLTLDQISTYTKISKKYLEAIEANDFHNLPPAAFAKGFLHTYAGLVDINPQTILAIFRRDYDQDDRGRIIPRSLIEPIKPAAPGITPNMLTFGISLIAAILIIGFFVRQIILFSSAPSLTIREPSVNEVLISPVTVRGSTDPQAAVTVNNRNVLVSPNGEFETQLELTNGQHSLIVVSLSRSGKKTVAERVIYVSEVPQL